MRANDWIHFPSNEEEYIEAKRIWQRHHRFPQAIGSLDCSLFPIMKPSVRGDEYICRKNFPALNVQATCDGNEMFTSVDSTWAGSIHDARVWRNSLVKQQLYENTSGALLLVDQAYPLTPWTMAPYKDAATEAQREYNRLHMKERVMIERLFGQLKRRFPILGNTIRVATERIPKLITACIILHNVGKFLMDPQFGEDVDEDIDENEFVHEVQLVQEERNLFARGRAKRDLIATVIEGS